MPFIKPSRLFLTICLTSLLSFNSFAEETSDSKFYVKAYGGINIQGGQSFDQEGIATPGASGDLDLGTSFRSGASIGYFARPNWSVELTYDYLTNSSSADFSDGASFSDGDYSSVILFLNNYYHLKEIKGFKPFLGAGLGFIQEIDVDIENAGVETSFSTRNKLAFQIAAGTDYKITDSIDVFGSLSFISANDLDMESESTGSEIKNINYTPFSLMFGAKYSF